MGKVRGTSVLGTLEFLRTTFGEERTGGLIRSLPLPLRDALGGDAITVQPQGWYECAALCALTREADRQLGKGDLELARAMGRHVAFSDVNRFFRWLLKLTGPRTVFSRAASVWNNYYDTGTYVLEEVTDRCASLRIEGWDSADEVLCRRIEGWVARGCELTLGEGTHPRVRETHHQARDPQVSKHLFCRFVAEWGD